MAWEDTLPLQIFQVLLILCESVPYGTIPAEAVTPRLLLLDCWRLPESVYDRSTSETLGVNEPSP